MRSRDRRKELFEVKSDGSLNVTPLYGASSQQWPTSRRRKK
jgi:hypothetical protein